MTVAAGAAVGNCAGFGPRCGGCDIRLVLLLKQSPADELAALNS